MYRGAGVNRMRNAEWNRQAPHTGAVKGGKQVN